MGGGDVIDLGCGSGAMGGALAARAPGHRVIGVDSSPAMLEKARHAAGYDTLQQADISDWYPLRAPGLVFANASLHWIGDHATLMPRLAEMLGQGGTLAVQLPNQNNAPSHRVWLSLAEEYFPGRVDRAGTPAILPPVTYEELLSPLGAFRMWETEYYQRLSAEGDGHPVRRFTESTFARPVLEALAPDERAQLIEAYEAAMARAYPVRADGSVLFPFRRLFFTLSR